MCSHVSHTWLLVCLLGCVHAGRVREAVVGRSKLESRPLVGVVQLSIDRTHCAAPHLESVCRQSPCLASSVGDWGCWGCWVVIEVRVSGSRFLLCARPLSPYLPASPPAVSQVMVEGRDRDGGLHSVLLQNAETVKLVGTMAAAAPPTAHTDCGLVTHCGGSDSDSGSSSSHLGEHSSQGSKEVGIDSVQGGRGWRTLSVASLQPGETISGALACLMSALV